MERESVVCLCTPWRH